MPARDSLYCPPELSSAEQGRPDKVAVQEAHSVGTPVFGSSSRDLISLSDGPRIRNP
jgi:hypothetical protein